MIRFGKGAAALIWIGGEAAGAIWRGGRLIWEGLRSCFGSGVWRGDKAWRGDDGWRG